MTAAHAGECGRIVVLRLLKTGGLGGKEIPRHHSRACRHRHAVEKVSARDFAMHPQFPVSIVMHDSSAAIKPSFVLRDAAQLKSRALSKQETLYEAEPGSAFLTANSAPWNPMRLWVPSQKGLLIEPPQRQSENAGLPVRSYRVPLASTSSIEPSGASTR